MGLLQPVRPVWLDVSWGGSSSVGARAGHGFNAVCRLSGLLSFLRPPLPAHLLLVLVLMLVIVRTLVSLLWFEPFLGAVV
jgi:hypothetical protein